MRLAIVGDPKGWYVQDLVRAASGQKEIVDLQVVPFRSLSGSLGWDPKVVPTEHIPPSPDADVWLVRSMPVGSLEQVVFRMDHLARLASEGKLVVNSPRSLEMAIDKYLSLCKLQESGLPIPPTIVTQSVDVALDALRLFKEVVVKPIFGSEGRGLARISDLEVGWRIFQNLVRSGSVLYVQKFIPNAGSDLRFLVIGTQVLGVRRNCRGDWRANVAQGAVCEALPVSEFWRAFALKAARAVSAEIAAVDCIEEANGEHYCLEVNGVPGWRGLSAALKVDVSEQVVRHLIKQWNER
jgi:RimK family alpha-L-glutamate ligase